MKKAFWPIALLVTISLEVQAQVTAIKAGKLVDPETGATAINQVILVEGKKIKAVGPNLAIPTKDGKTVKPK